MLSIPLVAWKSWCEMSSAEPSERSFSSSASLIASAVSSSRSIKWKPDADAFCRISNSAATVPLNLPPFATRRQVAIAVTSVLSARNSFSAGSAAAGLSR